MIERSFVIWLWEWALQYARISVSYVRKGLYFRGEKKKKKVPYWDQIPENINEIPCFILIYCTVVLLSKCNREIKGNFIE